MLGKSVLVLALAGSAAAFSPSMSMGRRDVLRTAAAGVVAAPLLRTADEASARVTGGPRKPLVAPVIEILDHRGCPSNSEHKEYKGKAAGNDNDEMCIVVKNKVIVVTEEDAAKKRQEFINFKDNGIDVKIISQQGPGTTYRPE